MLATLKNIYRYPVKGLAPEPLNTAKLSPEQTIPGDRRFAIENGPSGFDPAAPRFMPKIRFLMLMRNERLAQLVPRFADDGAMLSLHYDGAEAARGDLRTKEGRHAIEAFFNRFIPAELRGAPKILSAPDFSFSDVAAKVISIINLATVAEIENAVGAPVHPLRFRANLYVQGWPAWHEFSLLKSEIAIGPSCRLKIVKRIERCAATNVDPETGERDLRIPDTLMRTYGHADCGVYARVIAGGEIATGDRVNRHSPVEPDRLPF